MTPEPPEIEVPLDPEIPPVDPSNTLEWLFPGAIPNTAARDALTADRSSTGSWSFGSDDSLSAGTHCCSYSDSISSPSEYSYWSEIDLSRGIVKVQKRPAPGEYTPYNDERALFGILDNGVFWIGEADDSFGAGYAYGNSWNGIFYNDENAGIFHLNATWRGDAFGMQKVGGKPVVGPAELTISDVTPGIVGGIYDYNWTFTAWFKNVGTDIVRLNFDANLTADFVVRESDNKGFVLDGAFMGPQAEEVVGIFENSRYYGSFGLRK